MDGKNELTIVRDKYYDIAVKQYDLLTKYINDEITIEDLTIELEYLLKKIHKVQNDFNRAIDKEIIKSIIDNSIDDKEVVQTISEYIRHINQEKGN